MFWFKILKKLIKILNEGATPGQIAGAVALGSVIGLTPFFALHNILFFVLILLIDVNISSALVAILVFKMAGWMIDPLAAQIGYYLLVTAKGLRPLWTFLYNMPVVPLTRFNNTVMLGSLVISVGLFFPLYISVKKGVEIYRTRLRDRIQKMRIFQIIKASRIYGFYLKIKRLGM